jgi:hypothetical protein
LLRWQGSAVRPTALPCWAAGRWGLDVPGAPILCTIGSDTLPAFRPATTKVVISTVGNEGRANGYGSSGFAVVVTSSRGFLWWLGASEAGFIGYSQRTNRMAGTRGSVYPTIYLPPSVMAALSPRCSVESDTSFSRRAQCPGCGGFFIWAQNGRGGVHLNPRFVTLSLGYWRNFHEAREFSGLDGQKSKRSRTEIRSTRAM